MSVTFTFCIAHFNNPVLLERCLESIEGFADDFEIVVVDDASEQDVRLRLQEIAETNSAIKIYFNNRNMGVTYTKNKCYFEATGRWCIFIDCDDFFDPLEGRKMLSFLRTTECPLVLFHCLNQPNAKIEEDQILDLATYATLGTGGEALTAINKCVVSFRPYYGQLRGYEGLGLINICERLGSSILLSCITPRIYTDDSVNRLSVGTAFLKRLTHIAYGHQILLTKYGKYLSFRRKIVLKLLIVGYRLASTF